MTTDLKGRINQVWIAVGLICAVLAFGLAYYFTRTTAPSPASVVPTTGQLVVVAKVDIPTGAQITPAMLEETRIKGVLPEDAYTSCQELVGGPCSASTTGVSQSKSTTTASNYYAAVAITQNTVLTQNLVSLNKATQSPTIGAPNLPPGDVAIAIPLTAQQAVAGYLQAGDYIDLIASTGQGNTAFSFEDIPVIGIGSPGSSSSSAGGGLVVLQVTRSQALGIEELEKTGSIYSVALRSSADAGQGYIPSVTTPADDYSAACTQGASVNPIIEEDLQQAKSALTAATDTYNTAQHTFNHDNSALQKMSSSSPDIAAARQQVLSDSATLSQDQFSLIEAQNQVAADEGVLYCGSSQANAVSQSGSNYDSGSSQMMQSLFGFSIAGAAGGS